MKFAHLIEINDPLNPLLEPLSRAQLWRGLVLRAQRPTAFVPYLDRCEILEPAPASPAGELPASLARELHYGELVVRDRVTFVPQQQVVYQVPAQNAIPASSLTMTIEEPEAGIFFVRFEYDDGGGDTAAGADAFYDEFRRSAYQAADIDTICTIRQLAQQGQL